MKLIGSHTSLESLKLRIENYFYSAIELKPVDHEVWELSNSKGIIEGFRVIKSKGRYRFELKEEA